MFPKLMKPLKFDCLFFTTDFKHVHRGIHQNTLSYADLLNGPCVNDLKEKHQKSEIFVVTPGNQIYLGMRNGIEPIFAFSNIRRTF